MIGMKPGHSPAAEADMQRDMGMRSTLGHAYGSKQKFWNLVKGRVRPEKSRVCRGSLSKERSKLPLETAEPALGWRCQEPGFICHDVTFMLYPESKERNKQFSS